MPSKYQWYIDNDRYMYAVNIVGSTKKHKWHLINKLEQDKTKHTSHVLYMVHNKVINPKNGTEAPTLNAIAEY